MSRKRKTPRRAAPEPSAVWDFGGAFGASLQAWNRRRDVPEELADPASDGRASDRPRVISSRTRGVWNDL
jgi:hypothetical protein